MKHPLLLLLYCVSSLASADGCSRGQLLKIPDITICATSGDVRAQRLLGSLYFHGKEVPKNYHASFDWMSKAATQGDKEAQNALGFDYYNGWGTGSDHVLAYMWWSLSVVNNEDPITRQALDMLEKELSPKDLDRAQRLASDWLTRHQSKSHGELRSPQK